MELSMHFRCIVCFKKGNLGSQAARVSLGTYDVSMNGEDTLLHVILKVSLQVARWCELPSST